jgi:hypothetical protein
VNFNRFARIFVEPLSEAHPRPVTLKEAFLEAAFGTAAGVIFVSILSNLLQGRTVHWTLLLSMYLVALMIATPLNLLSMRRRRARLGRVSELLTPPRKS